jgi:hypothetical protein
METLFIETEQCRELWEFLKSHSGKEAVPMASFPTPQGK